MTKKTTNKSDKSARKDAEVPAAKSSRRQNKSTRSPILQNVLATAQDLHAIGLIDKITMREFDILCAPQVKKYTPSQIKTVRKRCHASQAVFAKCLNVTTSSLQKWEAGAKKPGGAALKLIDLINRKGLEVLL